MKKESKLRKAQLRQMIFDGLRPEMPELAVCHEMICITPVNSMLRGVILSPLVRSPRLLRVCTFARPLFCPDAGLMGGSALVTRGLLRLDVWDFDTLEESRIFQRLLRNTRSKLRRLALVDTPARFARNYVWVFGRRVTGWDWLRIGFCHAHAGQYDKAAKILRRKVLTWEAHPEVRALIAIPVIEAIEAKNYVRLREIFAEWEEKAVEGFRAEGANLRRIL